MVRLGVLVAILVAFMACSPLQAGGPMPNQQPTILLLNQGTTGGLSPGQGTIIIIIPQNPGQQQQNNQNVGIVDVFTRLNVRNGPSVRYQIIGKLYPGDPINILGVSSGWYKIDWNGGIAWVCGYYIWRPGMGVRNTAIAQSIGSRFPGIPLTRRSPAEWAGEATKNGGLVTFTGPGGLFSQPQVVSPGYQPNQYQPNQYQPNQTNDPNQSTNNNQTVTSPTGRRHIDGGLDVPVYSQGRVGAKYPSGFCGPTSLKMALEYYGIKKDVNYLGLQNIGGSTPVYRRGQGSGYQAMLDMVRHCGLRNSYKETNKSIAWLKEQTDKGYPVIVGVKGNYGTGRYTNGHILCVVGVTNSGKVIINDSARGKRYIVDGSTFYRAWSNRSRMGIVCKP